MIIYHGGYCEIKIPQIIKGRYTKDFGTGFYCTVLKEQAERWSQRYNNSVVNVYDYEINDSLNILEFKEMTEKWLDFSVDCRNNISHNYDIVIGAMADDQVYNYISDFISGILTREQFWVLAKFKHPTQQINFCTERSLKCLEFIRCEVIKKNGR